MSLFKIEKFILHSGGASDWKIDCDALTDEDIEALAYLISGRVKFRDVVGIPRGGIRLAKALERYCTHSCFSTLIVDDVLTTGRSMNEERKNHPCSIGFVIFARGQLPSWVNALFAYVPV